MKTRIAGKEQSNERGVSLVEVLVAMLLLATALMGLASSLPLALRAVALAGHQTAMALLAQQAVEVARQTAYEALPTLDSGGFLDMPDHPGFTRSVTVTPGSPTAGTTTVTVIARFAAGDVIDDTTVATVIGR